MALRMLRRIFMRLLIFFSILSVLLIFLYIAGSLQAFTTDSILFILSMCTTASYGCLVSGGTTAVLSLFSTHEPRYAFIGTLSMIWGGGVFFATSLIHQFTRTA